MKIIPILTEKSLAEAKQGRYSFYVDKGLNKNQIKSIIGEVFSVHVTKIKTLNFKKEIKKNIQNKLKVKPARKKAVVTLKAKEKIELFETGKK